MLDLLGNWECEPENEDKLECIVEWEPVDSTDSTLEYGKE